MPLRRPAVLRLLVTLLLAGLAVLGGLASAPERARAEGSASLLQSGGYRPFLEYRNDLTQNSTLHRQTVVKVYVNAGDTLLLASSANGIAGGRIRWVAPNGSSGTAPGNAGVIRSLAEELAGPRPAAGGFAPYRVVVAAAQQGIWDIHFVSPDSTNDWNPPETPVATAWNQLPNVGYVAAWDVTVRSAGGTTIPGRAYVNQLAANVGGPVANLSSQLFVLTRDGFRYRFDANGVQPFGFNLFANNKGFTDATGGPLYRSVNLAGANVHDPDAADTPGDVTHKIFFATPANDLPASAPTPQGVTWLRLAAPVVPSVSNLTFTGVDGTANQAGAGLGGTFRFTASAAGTFVLRIDLDGNGSFFDPVDRTLQGSAVAGTNSILWDGFDGQGHRALATGNPSQVRARVSLLGGEVHFPYVDAENNAQGLVLERQNGAGVPDFTVYHDDRAIGGDAALPPTGENSASGAHKWTNFLGDIRGMDTWTYVPGLDADLNANLLIRDADLELVSKTHAPQPLVQGQPMTWTFIARNNGPDSILAATILDTIPAAIGALALVSDDTRGGAQVGATAFTGQVFRSTVNVLPPLSFVTYVISGTVAVNAGSPLVNRALALRGNDQGDFDDPTRIGAGNNSKRDTATVIAAAPDLALTKSHAGAFTVGQQATWDLLVRNVGNAPTTGVITVLDTLPAGNTFVSGNGAGWTFTSTAGVVTATNPGPLANGASSALHITVLVGIAAVPTVTNTATVNTPGDTNPGNDRGSDTAPVASVADLVVSKTHAAPFNVGQNGTYTLTVQNLGPGATSGSLSVIDSLPPGLTYVNGVGPGWIVTPVGTSVTATYSPILPAGATASFTLTVAVGPAAYPAVTNVAIVTGPNDPNHGNDRTIDPTPVNGLADLAIEKRHTETFVAPGTGHYRIVIRNVGTVPTSGAVTVRDSLPAGLTFVSVAAPGDFTTSEQGQVLTATTNRVFAPGDSAGIDLTVAIAPAAVPGVTNTATVSGGGDGNPNNNTALDPTPVNGSPDIALTKSHPSPFIVGQDNNYKIEVQNVGTAPTIGPIVVRDTLPAGITFRSAAGAWSFAASGQVVTASFGGPLAPNAATFFTIVVGVGPSALPGVTNSATASTPGDGNPGNDRGVDPTPVSGVIDLTIDKRHTEAFVAPGTGHYHVVVSNLGNIASVGTVTVSDTLPAGLTFVSASAPADFATAAVGQVFTATTSRIFAPGDSASLDLTVSVAAAAIPEVINTAIVQGGGDSNPGNNSHSDPTPVTGLPDLALHKTHTGTFTVGLPANYRLEVQNVGTAATTGAIVVRDTLPTGLTYVSGSGGGWSFASAGQVVTATLGGTLAPNAASFCILVVNVTAPAVPGVVNAATVNTPGDSNPGNDRGVDPTPVNGAPDLALTKVHVGTFGVGGEGTYTLVVKNVGQGPTYGTVAILDTLPAGLTYLRTTLASSWNVAWNPPVLSATSAGTIPAAASESLSFVVAVDAAAAPSVTNAAVVSTPGDGDPGNDRGVDVAPVAAIVALSVDKQAFPTQVEIGDLVDYTVLVSNDGNVPLADVSVNDRLPQGFVYQRGSARLNGAPLADPDGAPGPQLTFHIDSLLVNRAASRLTYRVAVGAGAAIGQDVNTAVASTPSQGGGRSNTGRAPVEVRGGAFADEGIIAGKLFVDCDCVGDRRQGPEELGIPGVRLYMEDGTSAITDAEGKYHFANVRPRLHVVRIDATTLPPGARFGAIDARHAGDGLSRFVDLTKGEFHRADFAEVSRDTMVLREVKQRRELGEMAHAWHETPAGYAITPMVDTTAVPALRLRVPDGPLPADAMNVTGFFIDLPASADTARVVTLETTVGRFVNPELQPARDADPVAPGVQRPIAGGAPVSRFALLENPAQPGVGKVRITQGSQLDSATVQFAPTLRTLFLAGLLDARIDLRGRKDSELGGAPRDAFEDRLTDAAFDSDSGRVHGAARGALYATGGVGKLGLLTLRYDSEADPSRRLFRDITPDQGYDTYGDASVQGFDAQSRSRLYARLDHGASFALFGDFSTPADGERKLGAFSRSLNGGEVHAEGHGLAIGGFASQGRSHQQVDELAAEGVSGPYALTRTDGTDGSERVEILTRDRNQPSRILSSEPQTRFADYTLEPFTGRVVFRHPVPSVDADLNPVSIRVTYEVESGTSDYWVSGAEAAATLGSRVRIGAAASRDDDPAQSRDLASADVSVRLARGASLSVEVARSDSARGGLDKSDHDAVRGELALARGAANLRAWALHVEREFDNPSAGVTSGVDELGASGRVPLVGGSSAFANALRSRNLFNGARRDGVDAGLAQRLGSYVTLEGAWRWAEETATPLSAATVDASPNETHSVSGKLTTLIPGMKRASLFGEFEQDVDRESQRRGAFGADLQVAPRTRVYVRHENIASFAGPFALNENQQQATTVFGVSSDELREGSIFGEYRARDAFAGRDAQAAIGLRNRWSVARGLRLDASLERVTPISEHVSGLPDQSQTAVTGGLEYTRDPLWKGTARVEFRREALLDHWFSTLGLARKLSQDWTALGRATYLNDASGDQADGLVRFGIAYRQTDDDHWNALARFEEHNVNDWTTPDAHHVLQSQLVAATANWRPVQPWVLTGQLVGRWVMDRTADLTSHTNTELAAGRVTWEFAHGWDAGAALRGLFSRDFAASQTGAGLELGHTLVKNLRGALGWNAFGFHDTGMTGVDRTDAGAYVRLGFKFDEGLFGIAPGAPQPASDDAGGGR